MQTEILKLMKLRGIPLGNPLAYNFDLDMLKKAKNAKQVVIIGQYSKKKRALISTIIALKIRKQGRADAAVLSVYPDCKGRIVFIDTALTNIFNPKEVMVMVYEDKEVVVNTYDDMVLKQTLGIAYADMLLSNAYLIVEGK